jgi:hypothetical protein
MEAVRDPHDGTKYAKNPMYARARTVSTLSIAPGYRDQADWAYGLGSRRRRVLSDVVRIHGCRYRPMLLAGGLVVKGPTCVLIEVRQRGVRRVYRQMVSINMGANCPTPPLHRRPA